MTPRRVTEPSSYLPLKPRVFLMLLVLVQQGQTHGYALKEELRRRSGGGVNLGPGTLYRTIRSMMEDGFIAESGRRPRAEEDDERRRYYRITKLGRAVAAAEAARLGELVDTARSSGLIT